MDSERAHYFDLFQRALAEPFPAEDSAAWSGRGIVTCASLKFAPYLWILVQTLRRSGCTLPIDVWHMQGEVNAPLRDWLAPHGVTFCDAGDQVWGRHRAFNGAHGFKPFAILASRFREVLFLDADNAARVNPAFLFDAPEYSSTGAVFWSDPVPVAARLGVAQLRADFGVPASGDEFETGQLLVDKARSAKALAATLHMNRFSGYYYRFLFGDKETFHVAFDAARQPYTLVRQPPGAPPRDWRRWGHVQFWTDGRPLFHHRVGAKWDRDVTRSANHDLSFLPADAVEAMFDELRAQWPRVMPFGERMRPVAGRLRRWLQPHWSRTYFGSVRAAVRRVTERERRDAAWRR